MFKRLYILTYKIKYFFVRKVDWKNFTAYYNNNHEYFAGRWTKRKNQARRKHR